ncbi:MAG: glycosyltransferase family 2 protein [Pseudomonadota bacterium]|nr:glycosyltransferase family 2 protein [Pseudomonadota bacterium]
MPPATLSVILITKNESARIDACLASVAFADEWIVVDSNSIDDTRERARGFGALVVETADWPGFGAQKQRALDRASGHWVLAIDADERVTPELAASIRRAVADDAGPAAYELSRLSRFAGRWIRHGDWHPDRVLRLFRRGQARFSADRVHERVIVAAPVGRLAGDLLHETMPTLDDALAKMNRYSTESAAEKVAAGQRGSAAAAIGHAAWAFLRGYVVRLGFLDGAAGFTVAAYVAQGTFWRYLKMAELARALPTKPGATTPSH